MHVLGWCGEKLARRSYTQLPAALRIASKASKLKHVWVAKPGARGWSKDKKAWCCLHEHVACPTTAPFDCDAQYDHWQAPQGVSGS